MEYIDFLISFSIIVCFSFSEENLSMRLGGIWTVVSKRDFPYKSKRLRLISIKSTSFPKTIKRVVN